VGGEELVLWGEGDCAGGGGGGGRKFISFHVD